MRVLHLDDAPARRDPDTGADWLPLRHTLGIAAFGFNGWRATAAGTEVIERHTETDTAHQEVYVVVSGSARFTVGGETLDAPAGTVIFIEDPALERVAIAQEPQTTILTIGAAPGTPFTVSEWESDLLL